MSQPIKPMNTKEIAALYKVSNHIFCRWLKLITDKVGKQVGRTWNIKQIEIMYEHFGTPDDGSN